MRLFSLLLTGVFAALTAAPVSLLAVQPQYQQYSATLSDGGAPDLRAAVEQIFALGNQARAQAGAASLKWDPALAAAALQHCQRMAAAGPISHQYRGEPDVTARAAQAGAHFRLIEENVAMAPSAIAVHQAWMHSPEHRKNLLSTDVDRVGIAALYARGELYAVADYSAAVKNLSTAQVEARVASLLRASGVWILSDPTLARSVCANDGALSRAAGARPAWIMRWQNSDLSHLPQQLATQLRWGKYRKAAVGSCPPQENNTAFTSYRVAVLLY